MPNSCQLLPLADIRAGMVLADVILDAKGHALLAQGVVLTDLMLATLARHGIATLPILQAAPAAPPPAPLAVQARLDHLFRMHARTGDGDGGATGILRRHVEDYRLQREAGDA